MGRFLILALLFASPAAMADATASAASAEAEWPVDVDALLDLAWVNVGTNVDIDPDSDTDDADAQDTGNVMPEDDDVVDVTTACGGSTCAWASRTCKRAAPFESMKDRRLRPPRA